MSKIKQLKRQGEKVGERNNDLEKCRDKKKSNRK